MMRYKAYMLPAAMAGMLILGMAAGQGNGLLGMTIEACADSTGTAPAAIAAERESSPSDAAERAAAQTQKPAQTQEPAQTQKPPQTQEPAQTQKPPQTAAQESEAVLQDGRSAQVQCWSWSRKETPVAGGGPASAPLWISYEPERQLSDWRLLLVNQENPLPDGYAIETRRLDNGLLVDDRIYEPLMELLGAGNREGCALMVCSAYRPYERQVQLYEEHVDQYMSMGYSYEEACAITEQSLTRPGSSEHQAGLAVDIVTAGHQVLNEAYANTRAGRWLAEHAHEYGFILRYPKDKEDITGISYEPWHFRYVGKEAAAEMYELGCCLEEYVEMQRSLQLLELVCMPEQEKAVSEKSAGTETEAESEDRYDF